MRKTALIAFSVFADRVPLLSPKYDGDNGFDRW
jgi:hypothetical protein